jgi:hypothetical protein
MQLLAFFNSLQWRATLRATHNGRQPVATHKLQHKQRPLRNSVTRCVQQLLAVFSNSCETQPAGNLKTQPADG